MDRPPRPRSQTENGHPPKAATLLTEGDSALLLGERGVTGGLGPGGRPSGFGFGSSPPPRHTHTPKWSFNFCEPPVSVYQELNNENLTGLLGRLDETWSGKQQKW